MRIGIRKRGFGLGNWSAQQILLDCDLDSRPTKISLLISSGNDEVGTAMAVALRL